MRTATDEEIEARIDRDGIDRVIQALGEICHNKANHVREHWQDAPLATQWDRIGRYLWKVSGSKTVTDIL